MFTRVYFGEEQTSNFFFNFKFRVETFRGILLLISTERRVLGENSEHNSLIKIQTLLFKLPKKNDDYNTNIALMSWITRHIFHFSQNDLFFLFFIFSQVFIFDNKNFPINLRGSRIFSTNKIWTNCSPLWLRSTMGPVLLSIQYTYRTMFNQSLLYISSSSSSVTTLFGRRSLKYAMSSSPTWMQNKKNCEPNCNIW